MSPTPPTADRRLEGAPVPEILSGLARLHEMLMVLDVDGKVVWASEPLAELFGGPEQLLGSPWRQVLPRLPSPESRLRLGRLLCERGQLADVRTEFSSPCGSAVEVDVSAFRVVPVADAQDSALTVVILRRVEDRKREDRVMEDALDPHRRILDAAPEAIIAMDRSRFITYANQAAYALLGDTDGSLLGKPVALFLPHVTGFGEVASTIQPQGDLSGREFDVQAPGRPITRVSISTRRLEDPEGRETGTVAILRDMSESQRRIAHLERTRAELESFVHSVSHDLRSPLTSMLGFSRLLREQYGEVLDDPGRLYVERIEQAGRNLEHLLNDLLELSLIGRPGAQRTLVDPRAVLVQLRAELKPRLETQGTDLILPENPPLVACDRTRLYQVLSNLVGNALCHMGAVESPRVRVQVLERSGEHHIVVSDNGRGIPREDQERIFEPFQSGAPREDGARSTGMGLAIVKKIAESYDGRVWVESDPGRGTHFHFALPR